MKKSILIIVTLLFSGSLFAQKTVKKHIKYAETVDIGDTVKVKKAKVIKANAIDSVVIASADLKFLLENYYNKIDRAAYADKAQIEAQAAQEKKNIADYYQRIFPLPKSDTAKKASNK